MVVGYVRRKADNLYWQKVTSQQTDYFTNNNKE